MFEAFYAITNNGVRPKTAQCHAKERTHFICGGEFNKVEFLCVCRTEETSQAVGYHPSKDRVMTLINNINQTSIFASQ